MIEILLPVLKGSVAALILAIGLASTIDDVTFLWRRPGLLVRSLLAMYVLVPLAAIVLVRLIPPRPGVSVALLVLAVSGGAPLLPKKLLKASDNSYALSLVVLSSLLAVLVVPASTALMSRFWSIPLKTPPQLVGAMIAKGFLLPLVVGMLARRLFPRPATWLATRLMSVAGGILAVAGLLFLVLNWRIIPEAASPGMLTLALLMIIALVVGHVLGGPHPQDRTVLAIACATRHVAIAVLVAAQLHGPGAIVLLVGYILTTLVVSVPYLVWRRRVAPPSPV